MLLDMAGSQQALKARKQYKNPNEIHQFTNLPVNLLIYKGLFARCFFDVGWGCSGCCGEETLFNKSILHIVEFR